MAFILDGFFLLLLFLRDGDSLSCSPSNVFCAWSLLEKSEETKKTS